MASKKGTSSFAIFFVLLIIAFISVTVWMLKSGLETRKASLEDTINYLKSEYEFARLTINSKNSSSISFTMTLLNVNGNVAAKKDYELPGNDIFLESAIIVMSSPDKERALVFPKRLYSELLPPDQGLAITSLYDDNGFPGIYSSKDLTPELSSVIRKIYQLSQTAKEDSPDWKDQSVKIALNMEASLHQTRGYEPGKTYSCVVHPNGGMELLEMK